MSGAYSRAYYGVGAKWMTDECRLLNERLDKHFSVAALWTRKRTSSPGSQASCGYGVAPLSTAQLWPGEATEGLWQKYLKLCYSAFKKKSLLNLLQYCFWFFFFFWCEAYGLSAPQSGMEPGHPALKGRVLTTRLPGKSLHFSAFWPWSLSQCMHIICLNCPEREYSR